MNEIIKAIHTPMIKKIDSGEVINITECAHCELEGDPRDMYFGDDDQPYCSIMCAEYAGQTVFAEINE